MMTPYIRAFSSSKTSQRTLFTSRPFLICSVIATVVLLTTWLLSSRGTARDTLVDVDGQLDEKYGVVVGSEEYYEQGKFIEHGMETIPDFNPHQPPPNDIPVDTLGYNAVVIYLISDHRVREAILSLQYLHKNVPMQPWPIVLFHAEGMADPKARESFLLHLFSALGKDESALRFVQRIEFIQTQWSLPPGFPTDVNVVKPVFASAWPGYHLMCAFFAREIFHHPRLQNVTYYMRLDTDSYIFKPVCYDPIDLLHAHNRSYGYRTATRDPWWATEGLWDLADVWARTHPEVEERLTQNGWDWPNGRENMHEEPFPTYYNNFEVVKLETFKKPEVTSWLDEIMQDPERIFKYRWGDAPIRRVTVEMFLDVKKDTERYCGMDYWHNGVQHESCACENQKAGRT